MQVFVDDRQIEGDAMLSGTLGEALRHVQSTLPTPRKIVTSVLCDGEVVQAEEMADSLQQPLTDFNRVDVITSTREDLVIDVMQHASTSLEESETTSQAVAKLLTEGKSTTARESLVECLQVWQQIHDAVAKSLSMLQLDPETITVRDEPLMDAIGRPREVLLQVRDALVAGDEVLLADILQYEFADVVQTWQAIIARLRRQAEEMKERG